MQKIMFKYKGTMVKVTHCLKEEFEFAKPLITVRQALDELNHRYRMKLSPYTENNIFIVLEKDGENAVLLSNEEEMKTSLGEKNTITFYYPFKGG